MSEFPILLRRHLRESGLSMRKLALMCDLNTSFISRMASGDRNPGRATVNQLAEALDLGDHAWDELLVAAGFTPISKDDTSYIAGIVSLVEDEKVPENVRDLFRGLAAGLSEIAYMCRRVQS